MSIFLSYRHVDSAYALWLYPSLIQWFGPDDVFWDRKGIQPGARFSEIIEQRIQSAKAFVAVMSHNWLGATDAEGARSIDLQEDWIRRETSLALQQDLLVIPVLVGGMQVPGAEELPADLEKLVQLQMLSMDDILFHDHLRETLQTVVPVLTSTPATATQEAAPFQRRAANLLRRQIHRLQVRAVELIQDGKIDRATDELNEGSELLMAVLDLLAADSTLDAQLAYLFGTMSQSFARAGHRTQATGYRTLALSVFARLLADPSLAVNIKASAVKGIGGAYYENGDPVTAIRYYRRAIEILPDYSYAWYDLFAAYELLARRGAIHVKGMREAIDKTRELGEGQPGLASDWLNSLEHLLLQWQRRLAQEPHLEVAEGRVRLAPRFLVLVVTEADPRASIVNLNVDIVHMADPSLTLRTLEAEVTGPGGDSLPFRWTVFYDFQPSPSPWGQRMTSLGPAHEIAIPAGRSALGIQFAGPSTRPGPLWPTGLYKVDLHGSASAELGDEPVAVGASFSFEVGAFEASEVRQWTEASKTDWDQLGDPDRAIGIPVIVHVDAIGPGA